MDYKKSTLTNGLRVITIPMPTLESATVMVWAGAGSRYESSRIGGISHFLEHMVFKGGKKRQTPKEIAEAVDAIGAETNAATAKDWTNFYVKVRAKSIETGFDVISDMVINPLLRKEDIEREKGVITEEIRMYEDTPMLKIGDVFENLIFEGNQLADDIAGTEKSVREITRNDFVRYRDTYYGSNNMLITVAGGVTEREVLALSKRYFGDVKKVKETSIDKFVSSQKSPRVFLSKKKKEQAHFILGFLASAKGARQRYIEEILSVILGGGMSSRLFTEIREKRGLAYAVKAGKQEYTDTGYIGIQAGVDPKKAEEAIKVALDQCYGLADGKYELTRLELEKAKEYTKGHFALSLEDTKDVDYFFGEHELLENKVLTPDEVFEGINKVTIDDIYASAKKLFKPQKLNLAVIGPYKDEAKFKKIIS